MATINRNIPFENFRNGARKVLHQAGAAVYNIIPKTTGKMVITAICRKTDRGATRSVVSSKNS
jgi:hypothetical protein